MKFTASRLSEGNKLFPAEIHVEDNGLTVKIPGFLGGKSTFLSYPDISSVSVDTPLVGYSTVKFSAHGSTVSAHGFTKGEVKQIKEAIDAGKRNRTVSSTSDNGYSSSTGSGGGTTIINKGPGFLSTLVSSMDQSERFAKEEAIEREEKLRVEGKIDDIAKISFAGSAEEISNQLSHLVTVGNSKPDKKVKAAIIEKMEFGIMKLKGLNAIAEADFFEKKLEPLKKKSWF